jgi:hypothetical protein
LIDFWIFGFQKRMHDCLICCLSFIMSKTWEDLACLNSGQCYSTLAEALVKCTKKNLAEWICILKFSELMSLIEKLRNLISTMIKMCANMLKLMLWLLYQHLLLRTVIEKPRKVKRWHNWRKLVLQYLLSGYVKMLSLFQFSSKWKTFVFKFGWCERFFAVFRKWGE